MELCTSVHNKVREQKACEVLGRVGEGRELEAAGLGSVEQLEPKSFFAEPSTPGQLLLIAGPAGCRGVFSTRCKAKLEEQT